MIIGIGTDLIEIERIRRACRREAFLSRIYTDEECRQAGENYVRLAGSFAVKEAVSKVIGTGFRTFWPNEVEVLREPSGKPYVRLCGGAKALADQLGIRRLHVSITNTKTTAAAFAVGEGEKDEEPCNCGSDEGD